MLLGVWPETVTVDGKPRPVDIKIAKGLKSIYDECGYIHSHLGIKTGSLVKLEIGPILEFMCEVEQISSETRVWILCSRQCEAKCQ